MGRTHVRPILQPDEITCGPASIKHVLEMFGKRKSLRSLIALCKPTRNGTSAKNMIRALSTLGFVVMSVEKATLKHLISALKHNSTKPRAVIVSYLYYDESDTGDKWMQTGHWAAVSSFSASRNRIVLFDSYFGKRKSYTWSDFRERWMDYDLIRRKFTAKKKSYRYIKKWQRQMAIIIAKDMAHLPAFRSPHVQIYERHI